MTVATRIRKHGTHTRFLDAIAAMAVTSVPDLRLAGRVVAHYACSALGIPAVAFLYRPEHGEMFVLLAHHGLPASLQDEEFDGADVAAYVAHAGPADAVEPSNGGAQLGKRLADAGFSSAVIEPLEVEGELRGVLLGLGRNRLRLQTEVGDNLHLLALQLRNAIWNAERGQAESEARAETARKVAVAEGINRILHAALMSSGEAEVAAACLHVAETLTESEFGFLGMLSADGLVREIASSNPSFNACDCDGTGRLRSPSNFGVVAFCRRVIKQGRPEYTNTPMRDPRRPAWTPRSAPVDSFLGVPLTSKGRTIGILGVANRPGGYSDFDVESLEQLAPSIVEALARAHAEASMAETARLTESLRVAETAMHSSLNFDVIATQALEVGSRVLGADSGAVSRYEAPMFTVLHSFGYEEDIAGTEIHESAARHRLTTIQSMQPSVISDTRFDARVDRDQPLGEQVLAVIVVPLIVAGEVIGDIYYNFRAPRYLSEAEIDFVRRLAFSLSLAMDNARLFEGQRETAESLEKESEELQSSIRTETLAREAAEVLHEIARLALSSLEPRQLAQRAVSHLRRRFGLQSCSVWLADEAAAQLVQLAQVGVDTPSQPIDVNSRSSVVRAFRSGKLTFVRDVNAADAPEEIAHADIVGSEGQSYAVAPLRIGASTRGVLIHVWPYRRTFPPTEVALLEGVADQLALGFENARLYVTEQRGRRLNEALNRINSVLLTSDTTRGLTQGVVRETLRAFGADKALLAVSEGDWWRVLHEEGFPEEVRQGRYPNTAVRGMVAAARTRQPQLIADAVHDPRAFSSFNQEHGIASLMLLPLVVRGGVVGVLNCSFETPQNFDEEHMYLATRAALAISLGYETASHLEQQAQELVFADSLQEIQTSLFSATDFDDAVDWALVQAAALVSAAVGALAVYGDAGWEYRRVSDTGGLLQDVQVRAAADAALDARRIEREHSATGATQIPATDADGMRFAVVSVSDPAQESALVFLRHTGRFTPPEIEFLRKLGDGVGVASREQRIRSEREWLSTSRQQWLSGISHDLRTPLASIRGYAELLASDYPTPQTEVMRQGSIIVKQTERIQALVDDLLLTFQIKEGALPMTLEMTDLHEPLECVAATALTDLRFDEGLLRFEGAPGEHFAIVDAKLLERAVKNLVTNAVVHNPTGTRVAISVAHTDDAEEITVRDSGSGMASEQLARIWTRYERGIDAGQDTDGVGLGMSVSRQLVEAMGGTIRISSAPGEGTTAVVRFAAASPPADMHTEDGGVVRP